MAGATHRLLAIRWLRAPGLLVRPILAAARWAEPARVRADNRQVLLLRHFPKLMAILCVVLFEQVMRAEARAGGYCQSRGSQCEDNAEDGGNSYPIVSQ